MNPNPLEMLNLALGDSPETIVLPLLWRTALRSVPYANVANPSTTHVAATIIALPLGRVRRFIECISQSPHPRWMRVIDSESSRQRGLHSIVLQSRFADPLEVSERNGGDDETRTRDLCRDSARAFNDIEEHGRHCKSLEVHHRQRYCVSRRPLES